MLKTIGVVIPIYNTEKYLRQCVESVLNQKVENLRVVLVDDGSTDGCAEICDEFALKDARIHVIHQNNKGKLEARYVGASHLNTDYITFVDSDDWIAEDTYSSLYEYIEQDIDIISYRIIRYENENYLVRSSDKIKEGIYFGENYKKNVCPSMIWNEKINQFGIDPSLCNKLFKSSIVLPQLKEARQICISYGDDMAVAYPALYAANSYAAVNQYKYYHRRRLEGKIPEYFLDEHYYRKLTDLYEYLRRKFHNNLDYVRQLDMFFAYSANLRLRQYEVKSISIRYLFPFNSIPHNCELILYGAGDVGESYYKQITILKYCEIVAWVDQNKKQSNGVTISGCEVFKNKEFDYVVIALKSEEVAESITHMLIEQYDVDPEKIIWEFHEGSV